MKSDNATYTGFQFEVEGFRALAIINSDLKKGEERFSFPYSVFIDILPDACNEEGYPMEEEHDYLVEQEKKMIEYLETQSQSVHVGHVTVYRKREIIFYTNEPEKVDGYLDHFLSTIGRESNYEIEQDAKWNSVAAFYDLV